MQIVRKQLNANDVYPMSLQYDPATDKVQHTSDGGATWQDAPGSDPRKLSPFPPRSTAHTQCDAAASMVHELKAIVDATVTALQGGAVAAAIGTVIILIMATFGAFAILLALFLVFVDLAGDAGYAAISTAFTTTVWTNVRCILLKYIKSDGTLAAGCLPRIKADITEIIGGLPATLLNPLLDAIGEGGLNSFAALGTETGDCSSCVTTWGYLEYFRPVLLPGTIPGGDGIHLPPDYADGATTFTLVADGCEPGTNWLTGQQIGSVYLAQVLIDLGRDLYVSNISYTQYKENSQAGHCCYGYADDGHIVYKRAYQASQGGTGCQNSLGNIAPNVKFRYLAWLIAVGSTTQKTYIVNLRLSGDYR